MFTKAISVFALAAAIANAYTTPKNGPLGNSINKPGLNEAVPVGKEYTITWTPTTPQDGTVTLLLLRGPSENIQPLYPIVENIKNTGSYSWTPKTDLEPDVTHYGIQLIVDADGQYQWSTQFGISNPSYSGSASASASASGSGSSGNSTASASATGSASATSARVASTGFSANSSIVTPTRSLSVPSSLKTDATTTGAATSSRASAAATGAAVVVKAGGSLVMAGLGLAAALL